ncbi:MAG: glycosyltransferase family 4 protein [Mariniphaga sp.]|nr:glycosyltransferase family 4 protein [Mariniphaga sp.]
MVKTELKKKMYKMKILLVSFDNSEKAKIGGKHIHQELIKRGWEEGGHSVDIIYPKGNKRLLKKILRKSLQIIKIINPLNYYYYSVTEDRISLESSIRNNLLTLKYDFVSVQDVVAAVAVKNIFDELKIKTPVLLTLHGYFSRESVNYGNFDSAEQTKILNFGMQIEKTAIQFVNGIVTVDTRIKEYVIATFDYQKPIKMICNAIDDSRFFKVDSDTKAMLRSKINLRNEQTILLVARRLVKKNGVIYAAEAIKVLKDSGFLLGRNIKLLIVGRGPEQKEIEEFIINNNLDEWIDVVGIVKHSFIDSYYKSADIILMPSILSDDIEEATSLSMLEGLACGKTVIASAIGGLKEVITDGVNGILVKDKNPTEIADSIKKVILSDKFLFEIEKNAQEYAEKNCKYSQHSDKFLDFVIEKVI